MERQRDEDEDEEELNSGRKLGCDEDGGDDEDDLHRPVHRLVLLKVLSPQQWPARRRGGEPKMRSTTRQPSLFWQKTKTRKKTTHQ